MSGNRTPPRSRHEFNIAIICALPLEASIVSALFDTQWDATKYGKERVDTNAYSLGAFGPHNVVLAHMSGMGKVAAAAVATNLRTSFPGIQLALVVGICGGVPFGPSGELLLGDVVISTGLVQYDFGRQFPGVFVRKNTPEDSLSRLRPEVATMLAKLQTKQNRCQLLNKLLEQLQLLRGQSNIAIHYPGPMKDRLFEPNYLHKHSPPLECAICAKVDGGNLCSLAIEATCEQLGCKELDPRPRARLMPSSNETQPGVHFGLMATGDTVMRSGNDRDRIAAQDKVIAFEMEGAGVWEIFPSCLVIKGICDYADSHKNKTWQIYAAATAAAAAKAFLGHWETTLSRPPDSHHDPGDGSVGDSNTRQFNTRELEVMRKLYTSPYRDRKERNPDRIAGTCEWFMQHHLFQDWKESTCSRLLWVSADPGCGKSVLAKYIVDSILLTTTTRTVCYFFFKDDFEDQKSIVSALCCILHQLFQQNPFLFSEAILNQLETGGDQAFASFNELWHILLTAAQDSNAGEIICILDAIDECEDDGRSQLAKEFCRLYGADCNVCLNLKFLVTSRPFAKIRQGFQPLQIPGLPIIHLSGESDEEMKKISAEIDIYIRARVGNVSQRLKLKQTERQTLLEELMRVPNRTYLWVYLILDLIEDDLNIDRAGILQATAQIPKTVDEAYDRILSKSYDPQEAVKILHIIVAAERALTLTELGFALALRQKHRSHKDIDIKSEDRLRESIRNTCGLFVTVIHSRVYLLHQTAKEFLVPNAMSQKTASVNPQLTWKHLLLPQESHKILADICIQYLLLSECEVGPVLEDDGTQSNDGRILLDYSAHYWATHARESQVLKSESMVRSITKICDTNSKYCEIWLRTFWRKTYTAFPEKLTTLMVVSYFGLGAVVNTMLSTTVDDIELNARDGTYGRSALSWAAGNGFDDVVELLARGYHGWFRAMTLLLFGNSAEVNSVDASGRTPLFYAIWNGNVDAVKTLLKAGAQVDLTDDIGGTPFFYAMSYRREAIIKLLLQNGANPRSDDKMAIQLFFSAVKKGDVQVVQLSLDSGINIESIKNISSMPGESNYMTPLLLAVKEEQTRMVRLLLTQGANVESRDEGGNTPLLLAVKSQNLEIAVLLLTQGANIESRDEGGNTPLLLAVKSQNLEIAVLLLEQGANIDSQDNDYNTPLLVAVRECSGLSLKFVELLLKQGADIELRDSYANTPLLLAVKKNHLKIVQLLLKQGADIESRDIYGNTPLLRAVKNGNPDIMELRTFPGLDPEEPPAMRTVKRPNFDVVQLLVAQGADTESRDKYKNSPLLLAVKKRYRHIVQFLLAHGANIESRDEYDNTPLLTAVKNRDLDTLQLLLKYGANIEASHGLADTPMLSAARFGYLDAIQVLLQRGASIELRDECGFTPLFLAAEKEHPGVVEFLLSQGSPITEMDENGRTQLSHAAEHGFQNAIQCLLDDGADIDAADIDGNTPLFYAVRQGLFAAYTTVQLLLDHGADIEAKNKESRTPLCDAIVFLLEMNKCRDRSSHVKRTHILNTISFLLDKGAEIGHADLYGRTPLSYVLHSGDGELFKLLTSRGAKSYRGPLRVT